MFHIHVPNGVIGFREFISDRLALISDDTEIIVENFEDFGIRGADMSPLKIIGACEYLWAGNPNFHLARPIDRKFVSDEAMRNLGAYIAGGHHRDATEAARHAVAVLVKRNHKPTIQIGWPYAERF